MWIPAGTRSEHRELLRGAIEIHELPAVGTDPPHHLGRGQFVVADFWRQDFGATLRALEDVRVVQAMSAGIEDLVGSIPAGAVLCDAAGVHDMPVAEWVVMAILASRRELARHVLDQERGEWRHPGLAADDIEGATVLIVGYGSIGRVVEARLAPFGVRILRVATKARNGVHSAESLPELLPQADVVVVLLPLTPETEHFVDARFIASMRRQALLVNPSRGRIVDTEALTRAVESGDIRAAIDVSDPEPLPSGHPLWRAPGVLITPHVAGSVSRAHDRAWRLVADQLRRYLAGEPLLNVVANGY